jgi:hypothetical protein
MASINPIEPTLIAPVYFDGAFRSIGDQLKTHLSWLTNNYGRAERIPTADAEGRIIHEPLIYVGRENGYDTDYLNLMPDERLGNHVFFQLEEGQEIDYTLSGVDRIPSTFSMIFWWDYRDIYPSDHKQRSISNVLDEIYTALAKVKTPSFTINRQYLEAEGIYRQYNYQGNRGQKLNHQMQDQYMMRPYAGCRIEGLIIVKKNC